MIAGGRLLHGTRPGRKYAEAVVGCASARCGITTAASSTSSSSLASMLLLPPPSPRRHSSRSFPSPGISAGVSPSYWRNGCGGGGIYGTLRERRRFSTTTTSSPSATTTTTTTTTKSGGVDEKDRTAQENDKEKGNEKSGKEKEEEGGGGDGDGGKGKNRKNIFLDNLGAVFLSCIGLLIASLVRSYYGTKNKNALRDQLESRSQLDPLEIEDARIANSELTYSVYIQLAEAAAAAAAKNGGDGELSMTYEEFVRCIRVEMTKLKGEEYTVQLGHLLDRVVVSALSERRRRDDGDNERERKIRGEGEEMSGSQPDGNNEKQPLRFWLVVLSLVMYSPVPDRIRSLYEVMRITDTKKGTTSYTGGDDVDKDNTTTTTEDNDDAEAAEASRSSSRRGVVNMSDVIETVGYLQETCQLACDTQVVPDNDRKFPTQKYRTATPREMVRWPPEDDGGGDGKKRNGTWWPFDDRKNVEKEEKDDFIDVAVALDEFAAIARSKPVCAWGECYQRKKFA